MSCLLLSGPPSRLPVPEPKPKYSIPTSPVIGLILQHPCFSAAHKFDGTKEMALHFLIVA